MPAAPAHRIAWQLALAAVLGIAIGVATSYAQTHLGSSDAAALANSASPWLAGAFVAGLLPAHRRVAIGAGLGACVLEVVGYYVVTAARGFPVAQTEIVFWTVCAVLGGPIFGWAGWSWRGGAPQLRAVGGAFLPATFLGEAVGAYLLRLHYAGDGVLFLVVAAVLLVVVALRTAGARVALLAWTAALAVIGVLLYGPLLDVAAGAAFGG